MQTNLLIFDQENILAITGADMDQMLANGWRHFGVNFFRYNLSIHQEAVCRVIPLRIDLENYSHRKSFRKIIEKNSGFRVEVHPISIDAEKMDLFERHKQKFTENAPSSVYDFVSPNPKIPITPLEFCIYDGDKLIAVSFMDEGENSTSSIYGMYDLDYSDYSLGLFTMLLEIDYSIEKGKSHYYHGYCYDVESFYDYKKRFPALEWFDWQGNWLLYNGSFRKMV